MKLKLSAQTLKHKGEEISKTINTFDLPSYIVVLNKMYDFESRICENCRFDCSSHICYRGIERPLISIINGSTNEPSFECNKFEVKTQRRRK